MVVSQVIKKTTLNEWQKNNQSEMGRTQSGQSNRRNRLSRKSYQRGVKNNLAQTGLQSIGDRIKAQERSDRKQEEMITLNTFPERGGVAHHTHTNGKHLGYIYLDELSG